LSADVKTGLQELTVQFRTTVGGKTGSGQKSALVPRFMKTAQINATTCGELHSRPNTHFIIWPDTTRGLKGCW